MTRIARATLFDLPIDSLDEMLAKVDAVTVDDLTELAGELYAAERLSAACVGRDEKLLPRGAAAGQREPGRGVHTRVAVSGAAGRMGAGGLRGRRGGRGTGAGRSRRPGARASSWPRCSTTPTSSSTSPRPRPRSANVRACLEAGVHAVVGTTGFDLERLRDAAEAVAGDANCFVAPNFAIGAVLLMQASQRSPPHMPECEIVELHHDRKLDAPSGTAKRTAELIDAAGRQRPRADPLGSPAGPGRPPGGDLRRRGPDADDPPRLDRPPLLHARRAARRAQGGRSCPTASRSGSRQLL